MHYVVSSRMHGHQRSESQYQHRQLQNKGHCYQAGDKPRAWIFLISEWPSIQSCQSIADNCHTYYRKRTHHNMSGKAKKHTKRTAVIMLWWLHAGISSTLKNHNSCTHFLSSNSHALHIGVSNTPQSRVCEHIVQLLLQKSHGKIKDVKDNLSASAPH